jgi:hypothetical protein
MIKSLSGNQFLQADKCIAVFYSSGDLNCYFVEIHDHGKNFFLTDKDSPTIYKSLALAKIAAKKHRPDKSYIALDKTYEEFDTVNDFDGNAKIREYDYIPVD